MNPYTNAPGAGRWHVRFHPARGMERGAIMTPRCERCGCEVKKPRTGCTPRFCPPCRDDRRRAGYRERRAADPDTYRARDRAKRARNPAAARARNRRWCARNAERLREEARRRRAADPEKWRAVNRRCRDRDPEKAKSRTREWRKANPEKAAASNRDSRARRKAAFVAPVSAGFIAGLLKAQRSQCAAPGCDRRIPPYHVDHYYPLNPQRGERGGMHEPENIQLLCPACNMSKFNTPPDVFARRRGRLF